MYLVFKCINRYANFYFKHPECAGVRKFACRRKYHTYKPMYILKQFYVNWVH